MALVVRHCSETVKYPMVIGEGIAVEFCKCLGRLAGSMRAIPHLLCYWACRGLLGRQRAFVGASERIARIPGQLGVYTRQAFYRRVLGRVGADVYFGFMSVLSKTDATIGDRVYIGRFCSIGLTDIGSEVMLADGVQILSGRHQHGSHVADTHQTIRDHEQVYTRVSIGRGAWLGAASVIMADVGDNAIVGAGAVVVKPVDAASKVGGVPARALSDS